ncbi:MAG: PIG-L family deacetylase [Chloroflexota bacterium]|nr:PIG-L family deacetylase [Chloroflexota bacterium]
MIDMSAKNVLVITPHPDDAESGAGGTIAKWAEEGACIVLVVCTNGDKGTSDRSVSPEKIADTRREEQKAAGKVLGLSEIVFLDHQDQELTDNDEFREELVREIRRHKPDVVSQ